jgi:hypothetical protein
MLPTLNVFPQSFVKGCLLGSLASIPQGFFKQLIVNREVGWQWANLLCLHINLHIASSLFKSDKGAMIITDLINFNPGNPWLYYFAACLQISGLRVTFRSKIPLRFSFSEFLSWAPPERQRGCTCLLQNKLILRRPIYEYSNAQI